MKPLRPILAALMLVAWLFAGAHMAQEHGGDLAGACVTCEHCHKEEVPAPTGDHHHHDLGAAPLGKVIAARKMPLAEVAWSPLGEQSPTQLTALLRRAEASQVTTASGASPPDERASGWLFVSHTAHPVRGPSLSA